MELKELLKFIETENKRLRKHYDVDDAKMILAQTVKVSEEFGELCNDILAHSDLQRKQKLDELDRENIREEFADVLITVLILAESMNIDVEKALEEKIKKIDKRYSYELKSK